MPLLQINQKKSLKFDFCATRCGRQWIEFIGWSSFNLTSANSLYSQINFTAGPVLLPFVDYCMNLLASFFVLDFSFIFLIFISIGCSYFVLNKLLFCKSVLIRSKAKNERSRQEKFLLIICVHSLVMLGIMLFAHFRLLGQYKGFNFGRNIPSVIKLNSCMRLIEKNNALYRQFSAEKDSELKLKEAELINSKALLKKANEENEAKNLIIAQLSENFQTAMSRFKESNVAYLRAESKLAVRGGLENVRLQIKSRIKKVEPVKGQEDAILTHFLEKDKKFRKFLKVELKKRNMTIQDIRKPFVLLWHTASKYVHGQKEGAIEIYEGNYAENDIISLTLLFDYFGKNYSRFDFFGKQYEATKPKQRLL
jgi:hypothetical protein